MLTGEDKRDATEKKKSFEQSLIHFSVLMVNVSVNISKVHTLRAQLPLTIKSTDIKINTKISLNDNLLLGGYIIDFSIIRVRSI